MAAKYPAALPTPATDHETDDPILAATDNEHAEEIIAIATELGVDPAGSEATVAARIAAAESDIGDKADSSALTAHTSATESVHGISDTADLIVEGDSRLSDARTPTAHAASHAAGQTDEITPAAIDAVADGTGGVTLYVSSSEPGGWSNGDIWIEVPA